MTRGRPLGGARGGGGCGVGVGGVVSELVGRLYLSMYALGKAYTRSTRCVCAWARARMCAAYMRACVRSFMRVCAGACACVCARARVHA